MSVQTGVVDGDDVGRGGQGSGDFVGVGGGFTHAQVEGFEAAVGEEAVEGGRDGADGVLKEGEAIFDSVGIECGSAHEDVLGGRLVERFM